MESNQMEVLQSMKILEQLPIVKKLMKENKKLAKKNKELRMLVQIVTRNIGLLEQSRAPQVPITKQPKEVIIIDDTQAEAASKLRGKLTPEQPVEVEEIHVKVEKENGDSPVEEVDEEEVEEEEVEEEEVEVEEVEVEEVEVEEVEVEEEEVEEEEVEEEEVEVEEEEDGDSSVVEGDNENSPEEDDEVFEIEIKGKTYYTDNQENGIIYDMDDEGEISLEVGKLTNGKPSFYK